MALSFGNFKFEDFKCDGNCRFNLKFEI